MSRSLRQDSLTTLDSLVGTFAEIIAPELLEGVVQGLAGHINEEELPIAQKSLKLAVSILRVNSPCLVSHGFPCFLHLHYAPACKMYPLPCTSFYALLLCVSFATTLAGPVAAPAVA